MALSSCKVEYIATSTCACQTVWLMNLKKELCSEEYEVVTLLINNISAINLTKNSILNGRNKHIEMRFHYLRELASEGKLKLEYWKNEGQVADLLIKGVTIEVFKRLKEYMSMKNLEDLN